jgi:hypothetical protein
MEPITVKVINGICTIHYTDHVEYIGEVTIGQMEELMADLESKYSVFLQIVN